MSEKNEASLGHKVQIRDARPADRPRLLELFNQNLVYDQLTGTLIDEQLWDDPGFESALTPIAEWNDQIVGFGVAVIRRRNEGFVKCLIVDAAYQDRGIGSTLLVGLEAGLQERGARSVRLAESAPTYWWPGLDVRYTLAMVFFERRGYTRVGETFNMEADLANIAAPPKQTGLIDFQRARPEDRSQVLELMTAYWPAWLAETERCFANRPISLHLAWAENKIAGFSAYDSGHLGAGWFGPMGTVPAQRGRGIGRILLQHCLSDLKEQGHAKAIIPWVGPVAFYVRHAHARITRVFYRYKKNL